MLAEDSRVFSLEEANALVPALTAMVEDQLQLAREIQGLLGRLVEAQDMRIDEGAQMMLDIRAKEADSEAVRSTKEALMPLMARYREGWQRVQDLGAVVKDTKSGLIDLYGRVDDRLVWLCWRYGEKAIEHYHELAEGFGGRKPLGEARQRMLN